MQLKAGDASCEFVEFVLLAKVLGGGHAVQQVHRLPDVTVEALSHRQDRRQAGAAGNEDDGPYDRPQIEAALTAPQRDWVTRFGAVAHIVRHRAVGQQPDDELQLGAAVVGLLGTETRGRPLEDALVLQRAAGR